MVLNPGRRRLKGGESGVFMATSQAALDEALTRSFTHALHPASISHFMKPDVDQAPAKVRPWPPFLLLGRPGPFGLQSPFGFVGTQKYIVLVELLDIILDRRRCQRVLHCRSRRM